mgnify:CR=1 FL=1
METLSEGYTRKTRSKTGLYQSGLEMSSTTESTKLPMLGPSNFPQIVYTLGECLVSMGTEAYLVGGTVRDAITGRKTSDIDISVLGSAHKVANDLTGRIGGRALTLDKDRDIARIVTRDNGYTTNLDITSYKDSINLDLKRRDFTVDAMAVRISSVRPSGDPISPLDPHGGICDLHDKLIRRVTSTCFEEDPARLMRAPRLAVQLGFDIQLNSLLILLNDKAFYIGDFYCAY